MISDKFCAAKWNEFSINLQQLSTRVCHLSKAIRFTIEDYRENYLYFFHNQELNQIRNEMLDNKEPQTCNYCWRIEKGGRFKSERYYKTMSNNNFNDIDRIQESIKENSIYYPSYLEIAFNNKCNLRCLYCHVDFSSSLDKMIEKNNIRHLCQKRPNHPYLKYKNYKNNEYEEIKNIFFKKTFPAILPFLKTLRLNGGEISLQSEFEEIIDMSKNKNISLSINTNLSSEENRFKNFKNKLIQINNDFKKIQLFVSLDTFGKRAEWIRDGLNYTQIQKRIIELLTEIPNLELNIMCTLNVFCFNPSNIRFMKFIKYLKEKFNRTHMGIEIVRVPNLFTLRNLPLDFIKYYEKSINYMENNKNFFNESEINNFKKAIVEIKDGTEEQKRDFLEKIKELNQDLKEIKKNDFFKIFPEYKKIIKKEKIETKVLNNLRIFRPHK